MNTGWYDDIFGNGAGASRLGSSTGNNDFFSMNSAFGTDKMGGWLSPAMQGVGIGANWLMGNKQLDQGQEMFDFKKDSWEKMFAMQMDEYNRNNNKISSLNSMTPGMSHGERQAIANWGNTGTDLSGQTYPGPQATPATSAFAATPAPASQATGVQPTTPSQNGTVNPIIKKKKVQPTQVVSG